MTQLSKLSILGIGKETVPGTYVVPTAYLPFTKADFEDVYQEIKDESYRANDTTLQGMYQGPVDSTFDIDLWAYPDLVGWFLRGIIGPDTVTAGIATTLSSSTIVGATSITTVASIPLGSTIQIDTGNNIEYATTGTPSGAGPYTIPIATPATGLTKIHSSAVAVVTPTVHTFKQSTAQPASYSLTVYDTTQTLGFAGAKISDLGIKIDPKSAVSFSTKFKTFPSIVQSPITPAFTAFAPALGWEWTMVNAGSSSTRGLTYDLAIKRAVDPIHSSDGVQAPREIFAGTLDADGTYKAIFENQTDLNLYLQYIQQPATATLTQPLSAGGASLALTTSKSGWFKGKRDLSPTYLQANFSLSGIYNTTDSGAVSAVLSNYQTSAY
ncbi:MAG: phage tail tube protein [Candidatus Dormibacteria bacterium]